MDQTKRKELLEKIDSYIKGKLTQEEIEKLWTEFLKYPEMFRYFETEAQVHDMIKKRDIPDSFQIDRVEEPGRETPPYRLWVYAAVAALIMVIGLQFFSVQHPETAASELALASIDLNELVASDINRSDEGEALEFDIKINTAIELAQNDSTEMAIDLFRELLTRNLNDNQTERAELDLGILLYNKGEYNEAKTHFAELTKGDSFHEPFVEKGWWYYGNTLLNTGDIEGAHNAINIAYEMNGPFREPAFELMKKIDARFPNSSLNAPRSL